MEIECFTVRDKKCFCTNVVLAGVCSNFTCSVAIWEVDDAFFGLILVLLSVSHSDSLVFMM